MNRYCLPSYKQKTESLRKLSMWGIPPHPPAADGLQERRSHRGKELLSQSCGGSARGKPGIQSVLSVCALGDCKEEGSCMCHGCTHVLPAPSRVGIKPGLLPRGSGGWSWWDPHTEMLPAHVLLPDRRGVHSPQTSWGL